MKISKRMKMTFKNFAVALATIFLASGSITVALAQPADDEPTSVTIAGGLPVAPNAPAPPGSKQLFFRTVATDDFRPNAKEPWLGVGVEESPEPLSAQLDLKPGEGLVVTFVSTNSPAGIAGLQKNDVLVEFDGQMLVDPIQLRKLVQMHADGDSVKIQYYHGGKKESVTVKLVVRKSNEPFFGGEADPFRDGNRVFYAPNMPPLPELVNGKLTVQLKQANEQAKLAMDQAKRAVAEAMEQSLNSTDGLNTKLVVMQKKLKELSDNGMTLRKDATVVVKNDGESVRTMVKKDEAGTYVIVADPTKHLTAHDTDGKLLFDGPVDKEEQQQKVPKEVWEKVEPMLDQLNDEPAYNKSVSASKLGQE